jgi:AcrR family transcriptional regulator
MTGLRERHRKEREEKILAVAEDLFKQQGFEGTTIAQIADRANISPVTVFNYYKTKGELLLALIADENEALLARLDRMPARRTIEPIPALASFFTAIVEESLRKVDKNSWRQVIATSVTMAESEFGVAYANLRDELKGSLRALLDRLVANGQLAGDDELDALADLCYTHHYALFTRFVSIQDMSLQAYRRELEAGLRFLVNGARKTA